MASVCICPPVSYTLGPLYVRRIEDFGKKKINESLASGHDGA